MQKTISVLLLKKGGTFAAILFTNVTAFFLVSAVVVYTVTFQKQDQPFVTFKIPKLPPPIVPPSAHFGGKGARSVLDPSVVVLPPSSIAPQVVTSVLPLNSNFRFNSIKNCSIPLPALHNLVPARSTLSASLEASGLNGNSAQQNPFGVADLNNSTLLAGTFLDFTRNEAGELIDPGPFKEIVRDFIEGGWSPGQHLCYESPNKIVTNRIFVPITADEDAGKAFNSPESSRAFWVVHYHGSFSFNFRGRCRFVGFGDNVLIVSIDGQVVFDGSDLGYLERKRESLGFVKLSEKPRSAKPLFGGDWFSVSKGEKHSIDILIGDEGGVTTSGLFFQNREGALRFAKNGIPKTPMFIIGSLNDTDRETLLKSLDPECLKPEDAVTGLSDNN